MGKLTNDDLDVLSGKRKELAGRIQKAYGKAAAIVAAVSGRGGG
jgi:uncharacterized protein YjbJ (UPF0337 family)